MDINNAALYRKELSLINGTINNNPVTEVIIIDTASPFFLPILLTTKLNRR